MEWLTWLRYIMEWMDLADLFRQANCLAKHRHRPLRAPQKY